MALDDMYIPKSKLQQVAEAINPVPKDTFVFDNTEVFKTGRKATRTLPSGKLDTQVEVTPVHSTSGSWKRWARETELFQVVTE